MTAPAFDTLKAANALKAAGFDERQAEAVVTTIGGAVEESLVTKAHLGEALRQVVTVSGLDEALKEALEPMVTETRLAEKLLEFEQRMTIRLGGLMAAGIGILALVVGLF